MTIMPGASWRPITVPGGVTARTPGRAVVLHVAASEATSLFGFFNGNASANSHFYVSKAGVIEQYIDTKYQSWTSMAANRNTIGVETQGGATNPDGEPWTAEQVAALGRICAWAHATEGVPLTLMPNSLPASRGIGYHRLGIDPWRIAGGEVWSSSRGKVCPGAAKIAQIPAVIAAALGGADMPLTDADAAVIWNHVLGQRNGLGPAPASVWLQDTLAHAGAADSHSADARNAVIQGDGAGPGNNFAWLYNQEDPKLNAILDALGKVQAPAIDEAKLAAALLADPASVDRLGAAIAAHLKLTSS